VATTKGATNGLWWNDDKRVAGDLLRNGATARCETLFFGSPINCGAVGREGDVEKSLGAEIFVFPEIAESIGGAFEA
jgi:hypothetical protein